MTFYVRGKVDEADHYTNDGEFDRFVGWTGDKFISGMQSGIRGNDTDLVRFDESLAVDVYEIVGDEAVHRPNLVAGWS